MKKLVIYAIILFVTTINVQTIRADLYSGSISYPTGISAPSDSSNTNAWADHSTFISWEVIQNANQTWHYSYTFLVPSKDISHFILEVSSNFTANDFLGVTTSGYSVDSSMPSVFSPENPSNPFMPGDLYGLKFHKDTDSTAWHFEFDSTKQPMWGDFYAVDGKKEGSTPYAYNAGFGIDTLIDDGKHIAVPDTNTFVPVPGAVLLGILGITVAGIKLRKFA